MSLPLSFVAEVRHAFKTCARRRGAPPSAYFSTYTPRCRKPTTRSPLAGTEKSQVQFKEQALANARQEEAVRKSHEQKLSTDLIPPKQDGRSLDRGRKLDVPMKVLPQAQITPNLKLAPKERLHIEHLTRRAPPQQKPKVFKGRLLIYHVGHGTVTRSIFMRTLALLCTGVVGAIILPAHLQFGTSLPVVGLIVLCGVAPLLGINAWYKGMVTRIWLDLPPKAQQSAKLAMDYAKEPPRDAALDLEFQRLTSLPGQVRIKLCDTKPIKTGWISSFRKSSTFQWIGPRVDTGGWLRRNPTKFHVKSQSHPGRAARDVIPGLWGKIYERLAEIEPARTVKWKQ